MTNLPLTEPCPTCGETRNLTSSLHPGTSYIACDACGFMGPEVQPKPDPDGKFKPAAAWAAWNARSKAVREAAARSAEAAAQRIRLAARNI